MMDEKIDIEEFAPGLVIIITLVGAAMTSPNVKKLNVFPSRISEDEIGEVLNNSMVPARLSCTIDMAANVTNKCCNRRTITAGVKKSVNSSSIPVTLSVFTVNGLVMTPGSIF